MIEGMSADTKRPLHPLRPTRPRAHRSTDVVIIFNDECASTTTAIASSSVDDTAARRDACRERCDRRGPGLSVTQGFARHTAAVLVTTTRSPWVGNHGRSRGSRWQLRIKVPLAARADRATRRRVVVVLGGAEFQMSLTGERSAEPTFRTPTCDRMARRAVGRCGARRPTWRTPSASRRLSSHWRARHQRIDAQRHGRPAERHHHDPVGRTSTETTLRAISGVDRTHRMRRRRRITSTRSSITRTTELARPRSRLTHAVAADRAGQPETRSSRLSASGWLDRASSDHPITAGEVLMPRLVPATPIVPSCARTGVAHRGPWASRPDARRLDARTRSARRQAASTFRQWRLLPGCRRRW